MTEDYHQLSHDMMCNLSCQLGFLDARRLTIIYIMDNEADPILKRQQSKQWLAINGPTMCEPCPACVNTTLLSWFLFASSCRKLFAIERSAM